MPDDKPESPFGSLAELLASAPAAGPPRNLFEKYVVSDRVYRDAEIDLDGYRFINCAFIQCVLRTSKGGFHMDRCFVHLCTLSPRGNAARTIALTSIFVGWTGLPEGLRPTLQPDGSITIP